MIVLRHRHTERTAGERVIVLYFPFRQASPDKRKITVSISHAGGNKIYQGTNISDGTKTPLKIINIDDPNDVLFDGTVEYVSGGVELVGKYFAADNPNGVTIKAALVADEIP